MNVLPKPPPEIVTEVFPDEVLPTPTSEIVAEVFQKKEQLGELVVESTPRTKGDIIRFSDTEDSESGDESIDVTDIQQNVNFYLLQWKDYENVFMNYIQCSRNREDTNIETNLCVLLDELLRQQGADRGINNIE